MHVLKPAKKIIYLDHAATTPVRPEVLTAMQPYWAKEFGNPSTLYTLGQHAAEAVSTARASCASILHCTPHEIVFTAGGSESDNIAILGAARAYREKHRTGGHIITSPIEHHAVLETVRALETQGFTVTYTPVTPEGFVTTEAIATALRPDTFLVSIMYANNEIGTVQPLTQISQLLKKENVRRQSVHPKAGTATRILFHTDACQAAGYLSLDTTALGVDMLTVNSSKVYGPKQVGLLYVKRGTPILPITFGGGQENGLRSGTENVAGIVGFATALKLAEKEKLKEVRRLLTLQKYFVRTLSKHIPRTILNGPKVAQDTKEITRLPNNINVSFDGCDGEALVIYLDAYNIAAATGSACATGSTEPSHVLTAIGVTPNHIRGSLRLTMGKSTTQKELDFTCTVLAFLVREQRATTNMLIQ